MMGIRELRVNFYATLRQIVGQKTVEFELRGGATAQDVVDAVVERFPALRAELVDEQGQLLEHIHLFINGRDVPYLENRLATVVQPTDKLDFFPPVGGG
jgi:molybdopterin synthase sulfur carrier subunit